jgi:hypothetical protein
MLRRGEGGREKLNTFYAHCTFPIGLTVFRIIKQKCMDVPELLHCAFVVYFQHCHYLHYIALNGRMTDELHESDCDPIKVLLRHSPGGTKENHKNLSHDCQYPC